MSQSPRAIELVKRNIPIPRDHESPLLHQRSISLDTTPYIDNPLSRERSQSRSSNISANSNRAFSTVYDHNVIKSLSMRSTPEISSTTALSTK